MLLFHQQYLTVTVAIGHYCSSGRRKIKAITDIAAVHDSGAHPLCYNDP